ncbi:BMP family protein [Rhodococcus coprophilus]|uniref:Purine-binding protein BAB2_0673 n=1 Tax=Rhodococcus coprophilus TaxID=38310 RepID=A0A2X4X1N3_9NOCA|nr:BMP family protein [Rhodococcus coprophilus]MBM7457733.1 simple sugar transport system substrate-binding protein [Rhodococcus coprophilus]SQI30354.1 Purine-binding protein BAB2_0673 precursor [Rhodococcus coprophilus]
MKKLGTAVAVIAAAGVAVSGCSSSESEASSSDGVVKAAIITSGPVNDLGWNQGMVEGAEKLEAEGLIDLTVVQQDSGATSEQIAQIVTDLAEDGHNLIVGHSFNYGEPIKGVIADYPDVMFAYAGGFGDITANLADYSQPFYEASFLSGILAGDLTESGILAGTAGFEIPVCKAQIESFADGARLSYKGPGEIQLRPSYIGGWSDAAAQTLEAVNALVDQGADQFTTCGVDAATIEGAKQRGVGVAGYAMDQTPLAPENVVSSIVWNLDEVLRAMVADVEAGNVDPAKYYDVDFAEGGVDVAVNPAFADKVSPETMALFEEYREKIKSGEFEVEYKGGA